MAKYFIIAPILLLVALATGISSARAEWIQDGVAICTAIDHQYFPAIASDGAGGAIIAWIDERSGTRADIYAQRIDADGEMLWTANGVAVCTASGYGYRDLFYIVSDGSGGAIIAWRDDRNGPAYDFRIYAQRIDAAGSEVWTTNGTPICTANGAQDWLSLIPDGSGGAIAAWEDYRNGNTSDIYAQKISPAGSRMWTTYGAAVCTASKAQYSPWLASDGSGGAIIGWRDIRSDSSFDLYAQRIGSNGAAMWTSNGVAVCAANGDQQPCLLVTDGSGGAVFVWRTTGYTVSSWDISVQRIDANGSVQWAADGVTVCPGGGDAFQLVSDGSGGAVVAWRDSRGGPTYDVYAQRVSANGSVMWAAGGVPVCTAANDQVPSGLTPDGSGGAIVTMWDKRSGEGDVYAQRVGANGQALWTANGIPVCMMEGQQGGGLSVPDGSGGVIVAWDDGRSGNADIYAQRVDAAGHTVVATLLQNYAVAFSGTGIALTWTLSEVDEGVEFFVERAAAPDGPYIELPSSSVTRDGLSFSYVDRGWEPGLSYWYRVGYEKSDERKVLFETGPVATPAALLALYQNSPNPFNASTEIRYYVPETRHVALDVYDVNGALVSRLAEGYRNKGYHAVSWNGRDGNGRQVSPGVYFCLLKAGKTEISKKIVVAR